jgi:transcriptional regulator with XRE-family HTH domain
MDNMTPLAGVVRQNIRYQLARRGYSQQQFAAAAGVSLSWISRRLSDKKPSAVDMEALETIADTLDLNPMTLLVREQTTERTTP